MTHASMVSLHKPPADIEPRQWFRIENKADDESTAADVYIYDEIGGWWGVPAQDFVRELAAIDTDQINLYVNSPGGSVWDGIAMLNAIRRHPANVVAVVDGLAASAASFLLMGADEIVMGRNSQLMVHDASAICWGTAADMQDIADFLTKVSDNIADVYAQRAGGTAADWREVMLAETWFTADEAVAAGLADRVDKAKEADPENRFDLTVFNHAGRDNAPAPKIPTDSSRARRDWEGVDRAITAMLQAAPEAATPAEPVSTTTHEKEDPVSQKLIEGLRHRLGITAEDLTEDGLLAALDEALQERAADQPTNDTPAPGTVVIDAAQLEQLQRDAQDGRDARKQQLADHRAQLVEDAIRDGRIAPARREEWLANLANDPGSEKTLASLHPVVNVNEAGYTGGVDEANDEDSLYNRLFTKKEEN
ncbi:Clp protease ClpP [Mariniluteicoccus endophyticus]